MNYLALYKKWMKAGKIPAPGLCNTIVSRHENFDLFIPLENDPCYCHTSCGGGYWGYDGDLLPSSDKFGGRSSACQKRGIGSIQAETSFTPFRQNIVLFIAAMEGQL